MQIRTNELQGNSISTEIGRNEIIKTKTTANQYKLDQRELFTILANIFNFLSDFSIILEEKAIFNL